MSVLYVAEVPANEAWPLLKQRQINVKNCREIDKQKDL
jgi:hypothetical protein